MEEKMWKEASMSSKGQITLPKEMRDELGLEAGDMFIVTMSKGHLVLSPKNISFNDLAGFLGKPPNGPATLEEIDETVANAVGKAAIESLSAHKDRAA